jgi:hypothetical protein
MELFEVTRCVEHALVIRAPRDRSGARPKARPCPACAHRTSGRRHLGGAGSKKVRGRKRTRLDEKFEALRDQEQRELWW